jgi:excinuclease ABC subunit A
MRLKPATLAVKVDGRSIGEWCSQSVGAARAAFEALRYTGGQATIAAPILKEIRARLGFLEDVGLGYLTLDRMAGSLAGGEAQRIRLATQIGSQLTGVLYILDEPSIGLHHRDNQKLLSTLQKLRDLGNTVVVVEHDEDTMRAADWLVDLGPGAGRHGGRIVAAGTPEEVTRVGDSLTGRYLAGRARIAMPSARRPGHGRAIEVIGAREHNLKGIDVAFPLGTFTCVTGVSGSGKSTLVNDILLAALERRLNPASTANPGAHRAVKGIEEIDKVVAIDQSPIGRTPRSNPATYTGAFTFIRDLFANLPEAKVRGYGPGRFSFNVKGGRCETCEGDGSRRIEMHFLPDVYVKCDVCHGRRYNRDTLEVGYRGRSIADVLEMTVEEGLEFLGAVPGAAAEAGDAARRGIGLYSPRSVRDHALGRRGAARQARDRAVPGGDRPHALRARRADDRAPLRGRARAAGRAAGAGRAREYRARDRAPPGRDQVRGLADRPGTRRRRPRRHRRGRRHPRGVGAREGVAHGSGPAPGMEAMTPLDGTQRRPQSAPRHAPVP